MSGATSFFSPQLSTDFLELPQSLREKREIYRHFYNADPLVGQSIDLHTELPLSKVRLGTPRPRTCPKGFESADSYGKYILWFFETWAKKVRLFHHLITSVHHYWLDGSIFIFAEDSTVDVPQEVGYEKRQIGTQSIIDDEGNAKEEPEFGWIERADREELELAYYKRHYKGWDKLIVLPIDQVKVTTYSFTDKCRIELIPSDRDRALIEQAKIGNDPIADEMVAEIPEEVRDYISSGRLIPLGTDPEEGSFCYHLAGRRGAGEELGQSILDRCHIEGTPVLSKRAQVVQQIPIEELDPDTDLVLSHAGVWREFEVGSRFVSEEIILLHVAKIYPPIGCTKDHKYPVLRSGQVIKMVAGDIEPGDYLQVAQVPLTQSLKNVDLADFMHGIEGVYRASKSKGESPLHLEVVDRTQNAFTVKYKKDQTDPKKVGRTNDLNSILQWASTLAEPVAMRSAEVCERFGLHPITLKELRVQLTALGYCVGVTKGKTLIFPPNQSGLSAPTSADYSKTFPRYLELDGDLGYFLGFWLGDGDIARRDGLDYGIIDFTYGPNELASVASIEHKIKPMLDRLKVVWSESLVGAGIHMNGSQDALARWIANNFGHVCEDKHLPDWIFDAPRDFLFGLLRGFVDSDGDVVRKKDGSVSVKFNNTNAALMEQIFLLCTSLGIPASKTKPAKERWVKQANGQMAWAKPVHFVHFTSGPSVKSFFETGFLAKRLDPDVWKDGRSGSRHIEYEGNLYYRVQKIGTALHKGPVYSLNVHVDHTFYAGNINNFNCLRLLYYKEKLRQAQTQIASRAMTPKRLVWADDISLADLDELREQVDLSLVDPDYSIVTNYELHWEEMGSKDRLLDLSGEYELVNKELYSGLGVTESLLSGETLYSGDRLKLEVINTRYMFLREILQEYVEEYLFKPVARRKGFVEKNEWGEEVVLYPRLSFTRLPLRDSQDTFDALLNLYQKGSIPVETILELFNLDSEDIKSKLDQDRYTGNDATFNEVLRGIYGGVADKLIESTDVVDRIQKGLGLKTKAAAPAAEDNRF
jgi:intein/homing endonuclease